jgi:hypothetical protein
VTLQRGDSVLVIRDVPAQICEDCGEYYLDEATAMQVYAEAEGGVRRNAEVEIHRYAA